MLAEQTQLEIYSVVIIVEACGREELDSDSRVGILLLPNNCRVSNTDILTY